MYTQNLASCSQDWKVKQKPHGNEMAVYGSGSTRRLLAVMKPREKHMEKHMETTVDP